MVIYLMKNKDGKLQGFHGWLMR